MTDTRTEQLRSHIRQIVKEELNEFLPKLMENIIPELVKETIAMAFSQLILEASDNIQPTKISGNSHKRRELSEMLRESIDDEEEYPTMGRKTYGSSNMNEIVSRKLPNKNKNLITVDAAMTDGEMATPVPIDPSKIPDYVLDAFNKDYRPMLKSLDKLDKFKNGNS